MLGESTFRRIDKALFNALWMGEHCLGRTAVGPLRKRLADRMLTRVQGRPTGKLVSVDKVRNLSAEDFKSRYSDRSIPVVFEGAALDWPCTSKWTPDFIADQYGDDEALLGERKPGKEFGHEVQMTTLREVVRSLQAGGKKYARFHPLLKKHPELVDDFDVRFLSSLKSKIGGHLTFNMFLGGKNTKTSLHAAGAENLFVEVHGRKHWRIYPTSLNPAINASVIRTPYFMTDLDPDKPDENRYAMFPFVDGFEVTLEPGDILYNPSFFWHQVENLSDAIGVGVRWISLDAMLRASPTMTLLTMLSTSPPIWEASKYDGDFIRVFAADKRSKAVRRLSLNAD